MAKVSLKKCTVYDVTTIKEQLLSSIEELGGLNAYISPGDRVMLKVNLLMKRKPEEATTTHPAFTQALSEILIDYGADVLIADSPGGLFNVRRLKGIYDVGGYTEAAKASGAKLNFNVEQMDIYFKEAKRLKYQTHMAALAEVDHVFTVAKLKTHGMMTYTGAVKNLFGVIPGTLKTNYHFTLQSSSDFADILLDICLACKPTLSFIDGITGMEGDGPSSGTIRNAGLIMSSDSPFHLDKVACTLIGIKDKRVPTLVQSKKRSLIKGDFSDIDFFGMPMEDFNIKPFKLPPIREVNSLLMLPKFLRKVLEAGFKSSPVFIHKKCISCGACIRGCPTKVIKMNKSKPDVNLDGCIRCFCCHELCPVRAIEIRRSLFSKILNR